MKILVIGHLCLDTIHSAGGVKTESYGGIYYSLITLASLLNEQDRVIPVFGVSRKDYGPLVDHLAQFPNIETAGIFRFDEPTNKVTLFYGDGPGRKERSVDIAAPIPYEKIRRHLSVDGILVNMISGFDITLETLDHIRMTVRARKIPIHFDFHSLTLGVDKENGRFRRPVADWRRWAFMIDSVQLNDEEIAGLTAEKLTEKQAAAHLLTLSVRTVVVTRGANGATVYRNDRKKVAEDPIPAEDVPRVCDITGCGDIFGASFLLHFLRTNDPAEAAGFAGSVAASRLGDPGSSRLRERVTEAAGKWTEQQEAGGATMRAGR